MRGLLILFSTLLLFLAQKTTWSSARRGMLSAAGKADIIVGSPPEFKGEPGNWSPEELLVGYTCIMLTFLTLAQVGLAYAGV